MRRPHSVNPTWDGAGGKTIRRAGAFVMEANSEGACKATVRTRKTRHLRENNATSPPRQEVYSGRRLTRNHRERTPPFDRGFAGSRISPSRMGEQKFLFSSPGAGLPLFGIKSSAETVTIVGPESMSTAQKKQKGNTDRSRLFRKRPLKRMRQRCPGPPAISTSPLRDDRLFVRGSVVSPRSSIC